MSDVGLREVLSVLEILEPGLSKSFSGRERLQRKKRNDDQRERAMRRDGRNELEEFRQERCIE